MEGKKEGKTRKDKKKIKKGEAKERRRGGEREREQVKRTKKDFLLS